MKWLEANRSRNGVPYRIVYVQGAMRVTEKDGKVTGGLADAATPARGTGDAMAPGTDRPRSRPMTRPDGGANRNFAPPPPMPPSGDFGSGGDSTGAAPDDAQSLQKLNDMAPISAEFRPAGESKVADRVVCGAGARDEGRGRTVNPALNWTKKNWPVIVSALSSWAPCPPRGTSATTGTRRSRPRRRARPARTSRGPRSRRSTASRI